MSELFDKLQELMGSDKAVGFYYGAVSVLVLWVFAILCRFWAWLRYNRKLIDVTNEKDGAFQLTYGAVKQHVAFMLKQNFPQLIVKKIRISHFGSYKMHVTAQVNGHADVKAIREAVRPAVAALLDSTLGVPGIFSKINITISSLRIAQDSFRAPVAAVPEDSETQPEKSDTPAPPVMFG